MNSPSNLEAGRSRRLLLAVVALAAVATLAVTALLINIFERKQEAKNPFYRVLELNDTIDDPAAWGNDFPLQYDLYLRTTDMERTKYGGSEGVPHSPTQADPRSVVARAKLQQDPLLKINRSCQTCHHFPEEELKARAEEIQDKFFNLRNTALDALVDSINDSKTEKAKGATDAQLAQAPQYQRKGQFMIDFVMSENSMGFHAPQEAT